MASGEIAKATSKCCRLSVLATGFASRSLPPVSIGDGRPISSTSIRRAIAGGDLERAAYALGRPYALGGRVVPGAARGRGLGFPTINLAPPNPRKLLAAAGSVRGARADTRRGTRRHAEPRSAADVRRPVRRDRGPSVRHERRLVRRMGSRRLHRTACATRRSSRTPPRSWSSCIVTRTMRDACSASER